MKRNLFALLLAGVLLATMVTPAFADMIWEPIGDSFYKSHWDECDTEDETYLTNGPKGYVTVQNAPNSLVEVANLPNGVSFYLGHIWEAADGTKWGVGYATGEGYSANGWVRLTEMAPIYSNSEFIADHSHEFEEYDGSGDHLTAVCLYSYPGGVYSFTLEEHKDYMPFSEAFTHLYTDENGLHWTFVGYYMGRTNCWACIDDPLNETLGIEAPLTAGQVRGEGELVGTEPGQPEGLIPPVDEVPPARTWALWLIPVILVVIAAVVTAVIVRRRK